MTGFLEKILNVIFPKEISVLELEQMSPEGLLTSLPLSQESATAGVASIFLYKDKRVKTLIHEIKYNRNKILLEKTGKILADRAIGFFEESLVFGKNKIYLIPIPSSHSRENLRGYNPPEELAKEIETNYPESFKTKPILIKIRETNRQARLSRSERLTNLKGAFAVSANAPTGMAIIVDDISTTGATISEAKSVLENSNIKVMGAIVIAH